MSKVHDVLIIGGGPAGVIAGIGIAKEGYDVVIIDKKERGNIGKKNCGDALDTKHTNILFEELGIELPNLTVTEANPSHNFDFRRFSSDQVRKFNLAQVEIIKKYSPGRPVSHDYMGHFTEFDHRKVSKDLEISAWNSYPLGNLQNMQVIAREDKKLLQECYRIGDPDFQAYHHDLYRGMGRLWVMEQQPGPVNWAKYNPIPVKGAVRLWSWEAFAHDAEVVSYFRWRQAPYAQEQMHAGLMYRDNTPAQGQEEANQVSEELKKIKMPATKQSPIALVHDRNARN